MRRALMRRPGFVVVLLIASLSLAQSAKHSDEAPSPDEAAIRDYFLTMDKVNKYAVVSRKLQAAAAGDPLMAAEMKRVENTNAFNVEKAALIEKSPRTAAFLKANGMSARDFVLIPMTGVTAAIAAAAQDAKRKPPAFVNPANIQFVRDHRAELKKLELAGSSDSKDGDSDGKDNN